MLTGISPCTPLNPDLRQHKQMNACLLASLCGCLSAHRLILIVDRTCSAAEADEMRRGRPLQSRTLQQCWEDKLKHGTENRRADGTLLTDKAEISRWRACWQAERRLRNYVAKSGDRRVGLSVFPGQTKTLCCCWCLNSLDECQHHGLPADLSWWLHKHILMCAFFFVRMWVCTDSSRGHWPSRRNP